MSNNLALLHRYTLVRTHVKIGDHNQAAKLLIQVAENISRFPARKIIIFIFFIEYFFMNEIEQSFRIFLQTPFQF